MTKKDYQAIARAIHGIRIETPAGDDPMAALDRVTQELCSILAADNPRFDRQRFVEACETGRCKGMPR